MNKLRKRCDETKLIHNRIQKDKRSIIAIKSKKMKIKKISFLVSIKKCIRH